MYFHAYRIPFPVISALSSLVFLFPDPPSFPSRLSLSLYRTAGFVAFTSRTRPRPPSTQHHASTVISPASALAPRVYLILTYCASHFQDSNIHPSSPFTSCKPHTSHPHVNVNPALTPHPFTSAQSILSTTTHSAPQYSVHRPYIALSRFLSLPLLCLWYPPWISLVAPFVVCNRPFLCGSHGQLVVRHCPG